MKMRPTPHKAASSAPDTAKFTAMARLLALRDTINTAVLRAWCAAPSGWSRGTIRAGARHTLIGSAVAAPTESGASSRPSFAEAAIPALHGFGRGGLVRKAGRMAEPMCLGRVINQIAPET